MLLKMKQEMQDLTKFADFGTSTVIERRYGEVFFRPTYQHKKKLYQYSRNGYRATVPYEEMITILRKERVRLNEVNTQAAIPTLFDSDYLNKEQ